MRQGQRDLARVEAHHALSEPPQLPQVEEQLATFCNHGLYGYGVRNDRYV